jgi:amino acid permease
LDLKINPFLILTLIVTKPNGAVVPLNSKKKFHGIYWEEVCTSISEFFLCLGHQTCIFPLYFNRQDSFPEENKITSWI